MHGIVLFGIPGQRTPLHDAPMTILEPKQTKYPSIAKLSQASLEIFEVYCGGSQKAIPADCKSDLKWTIFVYPPPKPLPEPANPTPMYNLFPLSQ